MTRDHGDVVRNLIFDAFPLPAPFRIMDLVEMVSLTEKETQMGA
jgi:hypothetical protein